MRISGCEVRRGDTILDKVCTATYFDHAEGWDPPPAMPSAVSMATPMSPRTQASHS
jgi:hypothetical protein